MTEGMLCLIPARNGSKRLPGKNFRELGGKPLWQWTYEAALESKCFDDIWFCTNPEGAAKFIGASGGRGSGVVLLTHESDTLHILVQERPLHRDDCKDVEWVTDALTKLGHSEFAILRPTSPFRGPETIRRAKDQWEACKDRIDSLRAMRRASEHAYKQWVVEGYIEGPGDPDTPYGLMSWKHLDGSRSYLTGAPEMPSYPTMVPITTAAAKKHLHSMPTQALTEAYIQTAGLEMAWTKTVLEKGTIAGDQVGMFLMEGPEALDINTTDDWVDAENLAHDLTCPLSEWDHELGLCESP